MNTQQQQDIGNKSLANQMLHMIREEQNEMHSHLLGPVSSLTSSSAKTKPTIDNQFVQALQHQKATNEGDLSLLSLFRNKEYSGSNTIFVNQFLNKKSILNGFNMKEAVMSMGQVASNNFVANHDSAINNFE